LDDAVVSRGYQILGVCHTCTTYTGKGEVKGLVPETLLAPVWFSAGDGTPVAIPERSVYCSYQDASQEANAACQTPGGGTMKIRELIPKLQAMDPEGGVFVVVVTADGLHELFDVQEVRDENGNAQLEVQEHLTHR
jgi:hypothetical protein